MYTVDTQAADRYFEGRFTVFQNTVTALQQLNETQFIHDHQPGISLRPLGGQADRSRLLSDLTRKTLR